VRGKLYNRCKIFASTRDIETATRRLFVSSASNAEHQKTIFLIEEDDETRRILVKNLQAYGYRVIVALDEEDALERVSGGGGVAADLVLVNLVRKPVEQLLSVGRRVRAHARYDGHAPLVVMPEIYGRDVEGTDVNVEGNDWIYYRGDEYDQLKNLLHRLTPADSDGERR
jgi:CheY-like chemotaxis protein